MAESLPNPDRKIFCVGFNKSGTTSLHRIFSDQLSITSAHNQRWTDWSVSRNRTRLDRHQAFSDGDVPAIRNLDELYPNALFILNTRPLRSWILSRHKAVQRSKETVRWALTRYVPLGWLAWIINRWLLDNSEAAMLQWIRVRNSYHKHVLDFFRGRENKLLVLNIEDPEFGPRLASFLGESRPISTAVANQDGHGSTTRIILDAIGKKVGKTDSQEAVDNLFRSNGLEDHAETLTFFESESHQLSRSTSDQLLRVLPFLRPLVRRIYSGLVSWRSGAQSFFAKGVLDTLIIFFRSESDLDYFTTVRRLGSASK